MFLGHLLLESGLIQRILFVTEQGSHIFSDQCCIFWLVFFLQKNDFRSFTPIELAIRIVLLTEKIVLINFERALWPKNIQNSR